MSDSTHDEGEPARQHPRSSLMRRATSSAYLLLRQFQEARFGFRPTVTIERAQRNRVRRMIAHAYHTVPYYQETMRRLGLGPADFATAADLSRLPVIEREQLQRDPQYFVSRAAPIDRYLRLRSSGSTGAPRQVFHDGAAMVEGSAHFQRLRWVMSKIAGKRYSAREVVIVQPDSAFRRGHEFLEKRRLIPSGPLGQRLYLSVYDPPETNLALINEFRPDLIQGYGSYFELLFPYAHATGREFHRPKLIVYYYDAMSEPARRLVSETLEIPILSAYGAIEAFHIGFECEKNSGYHVNIDFIPLRIVGRDGRELREGESGEVIVSNLVNRATVLLNYRLGDVAALLPFGCPCGRSLPLLSFLDGRSDDWIESASGQALHPQTVRTLFSDEQGIWQWQVVQVTPSHYRVLVVARDAAPRETIRARLTDKFVSRLGEDTTIDVQFVEGVPRTAGGKVRTVVALRRAKEERECQGHLAGRSGMETSRSFPSSSRDTTK